MGDKKMKSICFECCKKESGKLRGSCIMCDKNYHLARLDRMVEDILCCTNKLFEEWYVDKQKKGNFVYGKLEVMDDFVFALTLMVFQLFKIKPEFMPLLLNFYIPNYSKDLSKSHLMDNLKVKTSFRYGNNLEKVHKFEIGFGIDTNCKENYNVTGDKFAIYICAECLDNFIKTTSFEEGSKPVCVKCGKDEKNDLIRDVKFSCEFNDKNGEILRQFSVKNKFKKKNKNKDQI